MARQVSRDGLWGFETSEPYELIGRIRSNRVSLESGTSEAGWDPVVTFPICESSLE
jgi:hypothetical protein